MQHTIIETVITASALLKECKLDMEKISQEETILQLNNFFNTTTIETVLLVTVFQLSAESNQVDREDLARYLDCNTILFFKYENSFKLLVKRKLLETSTNSGFRNQHGRINYKVSEPVHLAIVEGKTLEITEESEKTDPVELLTDLAKIIDEREDQEIETSHLVNAFVKYLIEYKHIPLFTTLRNLDFDLNEKMSFVILIEQNLNGRLEVDVDTLGNKIFSKRAAKIHFCNSLHNETNNLILNKWISFSRGGYFSNARVRLTNKAKELLKPVGIEIRLEEVETQVLIPPQNINKKKLFYNAAEIQQVATISNSLRIRNHSKIKKRLLENGLRTGICTLLYGDPGTGKTETVYQIAKQTGRSVWKVDLTELKSMWFGESQKKVKALFDNYKNMCKKEKTTPILLLNEADAILGTRHSNTENGAQSTNNAIQNIFLDCLEDFEGILFATTNLQQALDSAFERRFLFKIKFERPKADAQKQIWKAMLPELTVVQATTLSVNYNLSGGEIENVFRKLAMRRVLEEEVEIFDTVNTLCKNEQLGLKGKLAPIGYFN